MLLNPCSLTALVALPAQVPAARVTKKSELRAALQKMLDTPGPYLLDIIVPHQVRQRSRQCHYTVAVTVIVTLMVTATVTATVIVTLTHRHSQCGCH